MPTINGTIMDSVIASLTPHDAGLVKCSMTAVPTMVISSPIIHGPAMI